MSLRVQKSWAQLGNPTAPGDHDVPGLGTIVGVTAPQLQQARSLGDRAWAVLAHLDSDGFDAEWEIVEIRAGD